MMGWANAGRTWEAKVEAGREHYNRRRVEATKKADGR